MRLLWWTLGAIGAGVSLIAAVWAYAAVKVMLEMRARNRQRARSGVLPF
jgi:hypothetical protein